MLILSPDSLIVRLIAADHWTVVFWRGLLVSLALAVGLALVYRGETAARFRAIGRTGLLVAVTFAIAGVAFIYALAHTSVANTLIIASSAPLFAALFAGPVLGEAVPRRIWLAIAAALLGIAITVSDGFGGGALEGDLAALVAAVGMGAEYTLIRRARPANMMPALVLAGLLAALAVLPLAAPLAVSGRDFGLLVLMSVVMLPAALALMALGPRYIPAPEVGLLLLLETILGPFWVWLVLAEAPSQRAFLGGAIVIVALAMNALLGLHREGFRRSCNPSGI